MQSHLSLLSLKRAANKSVARKGDPVAVEYTMACRPWSLTLFEKNARSYTYELRRCWVRYTLPSAKAYGKRNIAAESCGG